MARERYLLGAQEDTIHTGVIELKTAREKRKNWWYYHKGYLLIGLIVAVIAASWIYSAFFRPKPDYSFGLVTSFSVPAEVRESLEKHIAQYADDRNGDGQVMVTVNSYIFGDTLSSNDYQAVQAAFTRFAGDATMGTNIIYFHDEDGLLALEDSLQGFFQYNNGETMPEEAKDFENAMRPWSDFAGLAEFKAEGSELSNWTPEVVQELCGRLRVSVRAKDGSNIEKEDKLLKYYDDSLALLDRLERGEMLAQGAE